MKTKKRMTRRDLEKVQAAKAKAAEAARAWRKAHPEKHRAYARAWRKAHPENRTSPKGK